MLFPGLDNRWITTVDRQWTIEQEQDFDKDGCWHLHVCLLGNDGSDTCRVKPVKATTCLRRPPVSEDHLPQKTTCLRRPPASEDHLPQKTTCLRRPPASEDHLPQKTTCLRRPPASEDHLPQKTTVTRTKGCYLQPNDPG